MTSSAAICWLPTTGVTLLAVRPRKPRPDSGTSNLMKQNVTCRPRYMTMFNLKDRHPYLPNVGGAPDLFKSLMPG